MSSTKFSKVLILIGITIAIVLGSIHLYIGFPRLSTTLSELGTLPVIWEQLFKAIWVIFGVHLFLISALLLYSVWRKQALPTIVVVFCGVLSMLDGVILASFAPLMNLGFGTPGLFMVLGALLATGSERQHQDFAV